MSSVHFRHKQRKIPNEDARLAGEPCGCSGTAECSTGIHAQEAAPRHAFVRVVVGKDIPGPVSGRLLVFAESAAAEAEKKEEHETGAKKKVDISEFHPDGHVGGCGRSARCGAGQRSRGRSRPR